jgi:hypothetical protein
VLKRAFKIFGSERPRPRIVERIGHAVASLVFDSFARPALVGVRSTETANRQLLYAAGANSIDLQIAESDQAKLDLIGQVLRDGEEAFESVAGLAVRLISGDKTVAAVTNQMGEFSINRVGEGEYDLQVEVAGGSITVPALPLVRP